MHILIGVFYRAYSRRLCSIVSLIASHCAMCYTPWCNLCPLLLPTHIWMTKSSGKHDIYLWSSFPQVVFECLTWLSSRPRSPDSILCAGNTRLCAGRDGRGLLLLLVTASRDFYIQSPETQHFGCQLLLQALSGLMYLFTPTCPITSSSHSRNPRLFYSQANIYVVYTELIATFFKMIKLPQH